VTCISSGAKILEESAVQISGLHKINHFDYYLHHFIEHKPKLFGIQSFSMNDAVVDVDVRIFSLKDTSKSNISSHHRWSAVYAALYNTIKLILCEKISTVLKISCPVVVECHVKQQRSSYSM